MVVSVVKVAAAVVVTVVSVAKVAADAKVVPPAGPIACARPLVEDLPGEHVWPVEPGEPQPAGRRVEAVVPLTAVGREGEARRARLVVELHPHRHVVGRLGRRIDGQAERPAAEGRARMGSQARNLWQALPDGALTPEEVAAEVAAIDGLLAEADRALRERGDLGEYQRLVGEASRRLADLQARLNTA